MAAHECGHAVQHATGYMPLRVRGALVPVANFGSAAAWPLILIGLLIDGDASLLLINLGIGLSLIHIFPSRLEGELRVGMEVVVPFGRGDRRTKGYITGFSSGSDFEREKIKEIIDISREGMAIETKLVALAAWMKEQYGGTMIQEMCIRDRSRVGDRGDHPV